jgi:enamine deaminase RidA (YjgF/YER057c/UK114 family)
MIDIMARISEPAYTTGDNNMTYATAANGKEAAYHGVPAEDGYGYAQAIKIGNTIHVSGQLSQDDKGTMIAPAALDESGKPAEFSMMAEQMRVTYANAAKILACFGVPSTTWWKRPSMFSMSMRRLRSRARCAKKPTPQRGLSAPAI